MSGATTASFALRHARQIQAMLEEVNSAPPAQIAVAGMRAPAEALAATLAGDRPGSVTVLGTVEESAELATYAALVVVANEWPLRDREIATLGAADRAAVPTIAALIGLGKRVRRDEVPYVLATDVVIADTTDGAVLAVVERAASKAKGDAYRIARALPHFREPVSRAIIRHYARLNGLVGAAAIVPGGDLPVLTINQLRMVARLAGAHELELDAGRLTELAVVVGASLSLRLAARTALGLLPGPGRAIKGGVALSGTTAIGEAALRRFSAETERSAPLATL